MDDPVIYEGGEEARVGDRVCRLSTSDEGLVTWVGTHLDSKCINVNWDTIDVDLGYWYANRFKLVSRADYEGVQIRDPKPIQEPESKVEASVSSGSSDPYGTMKKWKYYGFESSEDHEGHFSMRRRVIKRGYNILG